MAVADEGIGAVVGGDRILPSCPSESGWGGVRGWEKIGLNLGGTGQFVVFVVTAAAAVWYGAVVVRVSRRVEGG